MRYMIHACKDRKWYLDSFLIPSMLDQGINSDDIEIWMDEDGKGNLFSCMESFESCKDIEGSTWHLQDDVIISRDFYERTKASDEHLVICGFCGKDLGPSIDKDGYVFPWSMWWSFQCIQIPNDLAFECSEWFYKDAIHRDDEGMAKRIQEKKSDDWFWRRFLLECNPYIDVLNLNPNLVDHIDYLIGGSLINTQRTKDMRAVYFKDKDLVEDLKTKLSKKRNGDSYHGNSLSIK